MIQRLKRIGGYWLLWVLIFQIARCIFLLYHYQKTLQMGWADALSSIWYGCRMDMSMAAYFSALFTLMALLLLPANQKSLYRAFQTMNVLLIFLAFTIILCDLPAYTAWGYRLDATPLKYLKTPAEAMASVSHLPLFWLTLGWLISIFLTVRFLNRFVCQPIYPPSGKKEYTFNITVLLIVLALHILPIRGGWQLAPMSQSTVYFSNRAYANHAAVNATWNFFNSMSEDYDNGPNPFIYLDDTKANSICRQIFQNNKDTTDLLNNRIRPNILLIVWESGTEKVIDQTYEGIPITPGFSALKKEGIYFSNFFATGDRTDKGIVGLLSGYPAQPVTSIIKNPQKSAKLPTLPQKLSEEGYHTSFVYGGELEFANMKSYLCTGGFNQFISKSDFASSDMNSKWGAYDGVVADTLLKHLRRQHSPFFSTWLTLSSHEPFETPVSPVYRDKSETGLFINSHHYTDSILFHFISACKKEAFWKNTLVIIIADHGHRLPERNRWLDRFRIPMLWMGGAINTPGIVQSTIGAQTDLAHTLLSQLGIKSEAFIWSRNILSQTYQPSAYFSFHNGFGYINPEGYNVYDNSGRRIMEQGGLATTFLLDTGKAIQQITFKDYLSK